MLVGVWHGALSLETGAGRETHPGVGFGASECLGFSKLCVHFGGS